MNALRHTFLTSKYGDVGNDLNNMGTSYLYKEIGGTNFG